MSLPIVYASSNLTATANTEIHTDSSGGSFNINLPLGSTLNDTVKVLDIGRNWPINSVFVLTSGSDTFADSSTSFKLSYPGIYEFSFIGSNQWIYFYTTLQDPNLVNNVVANGLSASIKNNTLTLSSDLLPQSPNSVLAGPVNGTSAVPTFRSLTTNDLVSSPVPNGLFFNASGSLVQSSGLTYSNSTLKTPSLSITSTASMGLVTLNLGMATVTTSKVSSTSMIFLTVQSSNGTASGCVRVGTKVNGSSFTIVSNSNADDSTVAWMIVDTV